MGEAMINNFGELDGAVCGTNVLDCHLRSVCGIIADGNQF
jgi:hypothetical protein